MEKETDIYLLDKKISPEEGNVTKAREEICSKYSIPEENIIIEPFSEDYQQQYRICVIFKQISTEIIYYAEGNKDSGHMELKKKIIEHHNETNKENKFPTIEAIEEIQQLLSSDKKRNEFERNYEIRKGFIDPYANGFENFSTIKIIFKKIQKEIEKQKAGQDVELDNGALNDENFPNWFLFKIKKSSK